MMVFAGSVFWLSLNMEVKIYLLIYNIFCKLWLSILLLGQLDFVPIMYATKKQFS